MDWDYNTNVDGDDYEVGGKYRYYKGLLLSMRRDPDIPEDIKARRIETLKSEIIPFWHRCWELYERESEEFMATFLKYNGPDGIKKRYSDELKEMKTRITDADDGSLFTDLESIRPYPISTGGKRTFDYGPLGSISCNIKLETDDGSQMGIAKRNIAERPKPVINLVPFGGQVNGVPYHHNMNPDDDLSLKHTLLDVLQSLMNDENGQLFINQVEDEILGAYLELTPRPRHLKFIEKGLKSDNWVGYGATAFFNDMLLLFENGRSFRGWKPQEATCADNLEKRMKELLRELGDVGEQLLAQYEAIVSQFSEDWPDPELVYLMPGRNPHLPGYERDPDVGGIRIAAREQFRRGQERVQELRALLSRRAPSVEQPAKKPPAGGEARVDGQSRKRPRDEEEGKAGDNDLNRAPKRHRPVRSASPGPSNSSHVRSRRAASKRRRAPSVDDTDGDDTHVVEGRGTTTSTQPHQAEGYAASGNHTAATENAGIPSEIVPAAQAAPKRTRTPDEDGSESDVVEAGDGRGPAGSKRRRLMRGVASATLSIASPQAVPVTPTRATPEPRDVEPGSAQSHLTSPAGQPTPQPNEYPAQYETPSSTFLKFSRNSITMSKIAKMGKKRPWLFSYKTAEGYGIYAFVKCPAGNCKHHFSSHPLKRFSAQDHILACGQQIRDQRDMMRQYARQVIKDDGRKSDLTIDWARKSNTHLLPSDQQANHPENFPVSLYDE